MFGDSKPALANVLRWASRPTDDAEARRFFKKRLLVYFRTMGTLFGILYLGGFISIAVTAPEVLVAVHLHPAKLINLGLVAFMSLLWLVLRRREPSEFGLKAADLGAQLALALALGIGAVSAPSGFH